MGTAQSMGVFLEYERFSYAANLHEEVLKRHNGCGLSPEELNLLDKLNLYERVLEEKQFLLQEVRNIILYHRRRLDYAMGACDNRIPQNKLEPEQIKWLADSFRDLVVILKKSKPFLEAAMAPRPAREQSANNICEYL